MWKYLVSRPENLEYAEMEMTRSERLNVSSKDRKEDGVGLFKYFYAEVRKGKTG